MTKTSEPKIKISTGDDFTSISFEPDLQRFGMTELDEDTVALFERRAYDVAASTRGVKVFLNGQRIPVKNFKEYIDLYLKDKAEDGSAIPVSITHAHTFLLFTPSYRDDGSTVEPTTSLIPGFHTVQRSNASMGVPFIQTVHASPACKFIFPPLR